MLLLLSASFDFCTKGKRTGERERERRIKILVYLCIACASSSFAQSKKIPLVNYGFPMNCKSSWIDTALTHLRIFSACLLDDFQKDPLIFFFLYFSLFLSYDHGWILKNYEVEENRDSGEGRRISIFTESVRISLQIVLLPCFRIITMNSYAVEWSMEWTNIRPMTKD